MTIEKLYATIMGSDELKASLVAAAKEGRLAEFLKSQGCEATEAEVLEFIKSKQNAEGEIADDELDSVAGGCSSLNTVGSMCQFGGGCAY